MNDVIAVVAYLLQFLGFAIFARSIISWFPIDKNGPVFQALAAITDPILEPLRKVIPPLGMLDISPMVAMVVLFLLSEFLLKNRTF
ncbi:MAG: YggT family protein [Chloroflexi bacterium]|nr:MAG: YggT family protein [Chloroflexota bacterium]